MVTRAKQSLTQAVNGVRGQLRETLANCNAVTTPDLIPALIATSKTLKTVKNVCYVISL
jgi:hypothetical protein